MFMIVIIEQMIPPPPIYHDDSELSQTLSDAINSVVDSARKI